MDVYQLLLKHKLMELCEEHILGTKSIQDILEEYKIYHRGVIIDMVVNDMDYNPEKYTK